MRAEREMVCAQGGEVVGAGEEGRGGGRRSPRHVVLVPGAGVLGFGDYFQGGKRVWMIPGRLISGVVGNGHGQDGVAGGSVEGSTVGVAIGEFDDDGRGGVFRLVGGGAVDCCTMVVFGSLVGTVVGC